MSTLPMQKGPGLLSGLLGNLGNPQALGILGSHLMAAGAPSADPGAAARIMAGFGPTLMGAMRQAQMDQEGRANRQFQMDRQIRSDDAAEWERGESARRWDMGQLDKADAGVTDAMSKSFDRNRQMKLDSQAMKDRLAAQLQQAAVLGETRRHNLATEANAGAGGGRQETYTEPKIVVGPDGKQQFVRFGNQGGALPVTEYQPPPERGRNLPQAVVKELSDAGANVQDFDRLGSNFQDQYGGNWMFGDWENTAKRIMGDPSGQAQWWQDYQTQLNVMRNKLFGSALTPSEKAEFEKAVITPRMAPEEIRKNLARQKAAANRAAKKLANAYSASRYDREAIEGALGMSLDDVGKLDTSGMLPKGGGVLKPGASSIDDIVKKYAR